MDGTRVLIILVAGLAVLPFSAALQSPPPSGTYLNAANFHLISYDNTTGSVTDLGLAVFPTTTSLHCNDSTSDPRAYTSFNNPAQCGDCVYTPPETWQTPGQYTAGRCVTSKVDGNTLTARADIRIISGPDEGWGYSIRGFAINGDWFDAQLQQGSTTTGIGGCKTPVATTLGTLYYCSSTTTFGAPGSFETTTGCEDILNLWKQAHPTSTASCLHNEDLWLQTKVTTTRAKVYGTLSGHEQQGSQYANACC